MKSLIPNRPSLYKLPKDWKIDPFILDLLDRGVEFSLNIKFTKNNINFILNHRSTSSDIGKIEKLIKEHFFK